MSSPKIQPASTPSLPEPSSFAHFIHTYAVWIVLVLVFVVLLLFFYRRFNTRKRTVMHKTESHAPLQLLCGKTGEFDNAGSRYIFSVARENNNRSKPVFYGHSTDKHLLTIWQMLLAMLDWVNSSIFAISKGNWK